MPTVEVPVQITVENLMSVIKQLSPSELREFKARFADWQNEAHEKSDNALEETTRLALPPAEKQRLRRLITKSERGTLTEKELEEYRQLARKAEEIDAKRVEALAELTRRRGEPVNIVKLQIGWQSNGNDR